MASREAASARRVVASAYEKIWSVVRRIPRGRVMTYGQVAAAAGMPRAARVAGYAVRAGGEALPWHRVIGQRRPGVGHVSLRDPIGAALQRQLLERERVRFAADGAVDLSRYGAGGVDSVSAPRPAPRRPR